MTWGFSVNDENILKGLEQDAQVRQERMPMKTTAEEAQKVAAKLRKFIKDHKLNQVEVARMLGVGISRLNRFLNNKYEGRLDELINKSLQLIESITRKDSRARNQPFIQTTVAKAIETLIIQTEAFSDVEGGIGLVIGDGGHGKSHCLREYAEANKNTVYIELDDAMTSTTMFAEIAKKLKLDSSGSLASVTRRLIEALECRHIVIMLDETSGLTVNQLNQLRQIIVVKARCPLILAGNYDLLKTVMQPTTRRGFESLDQFTSRLSYILKLDELASSRDGGLYTVEDIRKLYQYGGIRLTNDAIGILCRISRTPRSGRLRTCSHIIAVLHTSRKVLNSGVIDAETIISAIEQLGLPVKVWLPLATRDQIEESEEQAAIAKAG